MDDQRQEIGQATSATPGTLASYETVAQDEGINDRSSKLKKIFKFMLRKILARSVIICHKCGYLN